MARQKPNIYNTHPIMEQLYKSTPDIPWYKPKDKLIVNKDKKITIIKMDV